MVPGETELRVDSDMYNKGTNQVQLAHEIKNAGENCYRITRAFESGQAKDLSDEPKVPKGDACLVIGSGGSLDRALPLLKDWKGGIICTTSHALTLVYHGIAPTHILALDPFCTESEIHGVPWSAYRTKLISAVTVWPDLITAWPNEMLFYTQTIAQSSMYSTLLPALYVARTGDNNRTSKLTPLIRTHIPLFASSPPAQMIAAELLGYKNIFLCGCDFGFTYDKDRFTNYMVGENGEWVEHRHPFSEVDVSTLTKTMNGLYSHPSHIFYKKNLLNAWRYSLQDVWTTDHGTITEMPYADLEHVIRKQGRNIPKITNQEKIRLAEEYLALSGSFVVETTQGVAFVETMDPESALPDYMRTQVNREYECPACHWKSTADTDVDQSGKLCPKCKVTPIKRRAYADIEMNMKRIRLRVVAAEKRRREVNPR
jgi:hypothetical protein